MLDSAEIDNPFPGLRPFETDENNLFFGRDGQSDELLERLRRTRFLAVVGTSGSGKSSLIRAGLLPALYGGLMGGAGSAWRVAVMRPGNDPIGNLAEALGDDKVLGAGDKTDASRRVAVLRTLLRRSTLGLVECVRQARMSGYENLLIVVDQFEELFRFKKVGKKNHAEDDAAAFVKLLLEAARHEDVPVYIVLTMRSDFLGDCAQFWGLPEAINSGQYLIPRMTRDERREAITGPVAVGGGEITPPLVNRLLNDMGDNPDHLPTLQHALMRSWYYWKATRRDGQPLDLEHYEAVGSMANALSKHADEAYDELADKGASGGKIDDASGEVEDGSGKINEPFVSRRQKIAERLFKSLTEKGADNREIRRPTRLGDICAITGASEREVVEVIDTFRREGRSFLMPPAGVALDADSVIDISHESLIRGWEKLKKWVNEEAESARIYRRLADAATRKAKGTEEFWGGPNLLLTLEWREQNQPNAAWAQRYKAESDTEFDDAMRFLDDSRAHRDALQAERERERAAQVERERQELERTQAFAARQAQAARRLRWLTVALLAISVLAFGTAAYAWTVRGRAQENERLAKESEARAKESEARAKESEARAEANEKLALAEEERAVDALVQAQKAEESAKTIAKNLAAEQKRTLAIAASLKQEKLATDRALLQVREQSRIAAQRAEETARAKEAQLAAQAEQLKAQEQTIKSQGANKAFRDAAATYQRDPDRHTDEKFIEAVKKFEEIGEADGVAASYLQLGYINLNSKRKNNLADGVKYFDEAARKYLSMSDPASAAATYESAGDLLLKPLENSSDSNRDVSTSTPSFQPGQYSLKREMSEEEKRQEAEKKKEELEKKRQEETQAKRLAATQYKQALRYYGEAGNKQGTAEALGKLFEFYGSWDDPNDKREAIKFFDQSVASLKDKDEQNDIGFILKVRIGLLYYDLKEDESGDKYFDEVVKEVGALAGSQDDNRPAGYTEIEAFSLIKDLALQLGQFRAADKYTDKAAQILQRERQYGGAAQMFRTNAEFYEQMPKNYAKALENYEKAEALYQTGGEGVQQANVISDIAALHQAQGNNDLAVQTYRRSLALYRTLDDAKKSSDKLTQAATVLQGINEYELALAFYQEAAKVSKANNYPISQAYAFLNLGQMHSLMNQPGEAIKAYEQAADIYRQEKSPEQAKKIQDMIDKLKGKPPTP